MHTGFTGFVLILFFVFAWRSVETISMQEETCFILVLPYRVAPPREAAHNQNA